MLRYVSIFGLRLEIYYLCLSMALLVPLALTLACRPRDFALSARGVLGAVVIFWLFTVAGAHICYLALHPRLFMKDPFRMLFSIHGLSSISLVVFGLPAVALYARSRRISPAALFDYLAPFIMIGMAVVRLGCLAGGCCGGRVMQSPWSCVLGGGVNARYPTQAYEIGLALAVFLGGRYLYRQAALHKGITFLFVFFWYGLLRGFNEMLRADNLVIAHIPVSYAVFFAIGFLALLTLGWRAGRMGVVPVVAKASGVTLLSVAGIMSIVLSVFYVKWLCR